MPDRAVAWLRQSEHDLVHARHALDGGLYDWACLAAAAAADKAVKAVLSLRGGPVLGGSNLLMLLGRLRDEMRAGDTPIPDDLFEDSRELMDDVAVTVGQCCFNGIAPFELVSRAQAEGAIAAAERMHRRMTDLCQGEVLSAE